MKKVLCMFVSMLLMTTITISIADAQEKQQKSENTAVAIVYKTSEITPESLVKIYKALGKRAKGKVAVKISTGEPGGNNYLKPSLIKDLVKTVKGTIVECNTAYGGRRSTTEEHLKAAREHGFFDIADVDIMDSEGDFEIPVKDKTHIKHDIVGNHLKNYDFMINLAHFKGHAMGGFGGVLKNQSIGVASSRGKVYIHSAGASTTSWGRPAQDDFLESMAAAAQGVADFFGENILYISVMNNISIDCDCDSHPRDPEIKDVGILASTDPVALDQACLDIIYSMHRTEGNNPQPLKDRIAKLHGNHIVDHAEKIGLGTKKYEIIDLDK